MDRRKVRKERRQEQVQDEILDAARKVVLERGVAGLTLSAVARELQLTKAALYYYFDSKEALVAELVYLGLAGHAEEVGAAIEATDSGAAALEALVRSAGAHYGSRRDELRMAYLMPQLGTAGAARFDPAMLARVRPFNDRIYGGVAERIARDQAAGRAPADVDGRRLAFLAHTSVLGMLVVEGLVERSGDAPLLHSRDAMVDELVATFTGRLRPPSS